MGSIPFLDHLGTDTADTLLQINNRNRILGMRAPSIPLFFTVVPEWIFRLEMPLNSSTTADSIRYHEPTVITGAFDFAHATNRIPPVSSAIIPLWAMAGDPGAESATILPSMVTHSPGDKSAIFFVSVALPLFPPPLPIPICGMIELFCEFIGYTAFRFRRLDTELLHETAEFPLDLFGIDVLSALLELTGDSVCCFGKVHIRTSPRTIGSDHAYILRSMHSESKSPLS